MSPPQDKAETDCGALQRIVQYSQYLFIIGVPCLNVGKLVEVHQFIQTNQHAFESGKSHKLGHQFQMVIERAIIDYSSYPEGIAGVGLRRELGAKPANCICLQLLVASIMAFVRNGPRTRRCGFWTLLRRSCALHLFYC